MKDFFVDLHIHIGRTASGKPVKITGSRTLTLPAILQYANGQKGLNMIGVIDCHVPEVLVEIEQFIKQGEITELAEGGLRYQATTLILGSEIEVYDTNCHGPIHVLTYFSTVEKMKAFSQWMSKHVKNIALSTQRIYVDGRMLQHKVREYGGLFIPAHVFTPFKSLYGKGVRSSLTEVFDAQLIDGMELGLSSDTEMVKHIKELYPYPFLTNSDAHSLSKMGREYGKFLMQDSTFNELQKALRHEEGRSIIANYGLNPLLGKYYRSVCFNCGAQANKVAECGAQVNKLDNNSEQGNMLSMCGNKANLQEEICPQCGSSDMIKGVSTRIEELSDEDAVPVVRPPYIHQVPLDFIPGLGPKTIKRLLDAFGTEMNILHHVTKEQLLEVVPEKLGEFIHRARQGKLNIVHGGGGKYGKVLGEM